MTDDDGNGTPPSEDDGEKTITLGQVEDVVRKVLTEMMPGNDPPKVELDSDDDAPVYSVRQAEDLARRVVEEAMAKLKTKPAKAPPSKPDAKPTEGVPTPPEPTPALLGSRIRKFLVGD